MNRHRCKGVIMAGAAVLFLQGALCSAATKNESDSVAVTTVAAADSSENLIQKIKKTRIVRDFPTIYEDTTTFEKGTFVFRAVLMKKFWRRWRWLTSRERTPKELPDSASTAGRDTVAEEHPIVRFVGRNQ